MPLWTDIIDPATLTGYARASLANYELRRGTLAQFLPNRDVADIVVRFVKGPNGFVDAAKFRAYDAEPEVGRRPSSRRVTLELPALGQNIPVSEYEQLRMRSGNVDEQVALATIQNATDAAVQSISDSIEKLRGTVLATGKATIAQDNFTSEDDFGRSAGFTTTAPTLWSATTARLEYLQTLCDLYRDTNGENPGCIVMPQRVFRSLQTGAELQTQLVNGGARRPGEDEVNTIVTGAGLPPIVRYDRRVPVNGSMTSVLPTDTLLLLPEPVAPDDWQGTDLGATFWGRTLTSTEADWDIAELERPGIVTGVWRNDKPPMTVEVLSDAIGLPVLANADRSLAAKVL